MLVVVGAILAAKWLRRSRRRSTRLVSGRIAGAWRELVDHARASLAPFKLPKAIHFVDELPRNQSGKLLKRVLRDQL